MVVKLPVGLRPIGKLKTYLTKLKQRTGTHTQKWNTPCKTNTKIGKQILKEATNQYPPKYAKIDANEEFKL